MFGGLNDKELKAAEELIVNELQTWSHSLDCLRAGAVVWDSPDRILLQYIEWSLKFQAVRDEIARRETAARDMHFSINTKVSTL